MRLVKQPDDMPNALEKISTDALDAEQFRQLRRCDVKRGTRLESDQNGVRDKIGCIGEAHIAAGNADDANHQRDRRRQGQGPRKIAVCHHHDAGGDYERHCRRRSDCQLAARSKYRVGNSSNEIAIEAGDRRELRQGRVGEGLRDDEGRERQPGDQVETHALPRVRADPAKRRRPGKIRLENCLVIHVRAPFDALDEAGSLGH